MIFELPREEDEMNEKIKAMGKPLKITPLSDIISFITFCDSLSYVSLKVLSVSYFPLKMSVEVNFHHVIDECNTNEEPS